MIFNTKNNIEKQDFLSQAKRLADEECIIELKKKRKQRSLRQNSYMHVCITLFAIEFGYTMEEAKALLKRNCHFMVYEKNNQKFLKSTKDLDTKEMTDFIEWMRNYASNHGLFIPSSQDYIDNKYFFDKQIDSHKQYL